MKVAIEQLCEKDIQKFTELIYLFEDVFEMEDFVIPGSDHLVKLLANPNFIVLVASANNEIVGGLTAYVLDQYYSTRPLAYIYDLAVKKQEQRKGIGKKLISAFNQFCQEIGFEEVFVQADKEEQHAVNFYRSTDPTEEEQVIHFYYTL